MFDYAEVHPIFGPPGTGKTTTCIAIVSDLIEKGVDPRQIAYVAFTNKAANEARDRVAKQLKISKTGLRHFTTIHAMANRAYRAEFPDNSRLMQPSDFQAVGNRSGLPIRQHWKIVEDEDLVSTGGVAYGAGDVALSQINLAYARGIPLLKQLDRHDSCQTLSKFGLTPWAVIAFNDALDSYKKLEDRYDFNNMLSRSLSCHPLPVEYAIIDEAQDNSMAQWNVCDHLLKNCKKIWVAGDDDQAIYGFSGADPNTFLGMGQLDTARVLQQTHRLSSAVFDFSQRIISRVSTRVPKEWHTDKPGGRVHVNIPMASIDTDSGEWMVLVRNRSFMKRFEAAFRSQSLPYKIDGKSSLPHAFVEAIRAWETVRKGGLITVAQAGSLYSQMDVGHGIERGWKTTIRSRLLQDDKEKVSLQDLMQRGLLLPATMPWFEALRGIIPSQMAYLQGVARRGELFDEPRISINTIHGVKGGEADNVIVCPDMGNLTWESYRRNPQDEHRCAYVAATRARENLYVLAGHTEKQYFYV